VLGLIEKVLNKVRLSYPFRLILSIGIIGYSRLRWAGSFWIPAFAGMINTRLLAVWNFEAYDVSGS
jgi:hypothetical protein